MRFTEISESPAKQDISFLVEELSNTSLQRIILEKLLNGWDSPLRVGTLLGGHLPYGRCVISPQELIFITNGIWKSLMIILKTER